MTAIQVVNEKQIKYDERGQSVATEETYVKIAVAFSELLQTFKGARLSVFLALALNEAEMSFGRSAGLSIYDIADQTGYTVRNVLRTTQWLSEHDYAQVAGRGDRGEHLYRIKGFAWFGAQRADVPANGYDKMSDPPGYDKTDTPGMTKRAKGVTKHALRRSRSTKSFEDFESSSSSHSRACEKILQDCGIALLGLDLREMTDERAEGIAAYVRANPDQKKKPAAYAYTCLKHNPLWEPPKVKAHWYAEYEHLIHK